MIKKAIFLGLMILWDFSLHLVDVLDKVELHFLYPNFPLYGISYDIFWTSFWGLGFLIAITVIFTSIKPKEIKTVNNIHIHSPEVKQKPQAQMPSLEEMGIPDGSDNFKSLNEYRIT